MEWDRVVAKYAPKTTLSLLKLTREFKNRMLKSFEKNPKDWINDLKGLRIEIKLINKQKSI